MPLNDVGTPSVLILPMLFGAFRPPKPENMTRLRYAPDGHGYIFSCTAIIFHLFQFVYARVCYHGHRFRVARFFPATRHGGADGFLCGDCDPGSSVSPWHHWSNCLSSTGKGRRCARRFELGFMRGADDCSARRTTVKSSAAPTALGFVEIDFPALPGWADVWRSAFQASGPRLH